MSHHSVIVERQIYKFDKCHALKGLMLRIRDLNKALVINISLVFYICEFIYLFNIILDNFVFNLSVNIFAYIFFNCLNIYIFYIKLY